MDSAWSKSHPFRVPNWRWCRASTLAEQPTIARSDDNDEEVLRAVRFVRKLNEKQRLPQPEEYAYRAYTNELYAPFRWELEARLLANQPSSLIAERLGAPERTVACYEAWFYNVRDKLNNPSYIYHMLVYPIAGDGPTKEAIWKIYALTGSPDILDEVIYDGKKLAVDGGGRFWVEELLSTLARRCAIGARFADGVNLTRLSKMLQALKTLCAPTQQQAQPMVADQLKSLVMAMKWDWSEEDKRDPGTMIGHASLKADELQLLASNEPSPQFQRFLESAKYPLAQAGD
jgi:hypothetical protein